MNGSKGFIELTQQWENIRRHYIVVLAQMTSLSSTFFYLGSNEAIWLRK
jgi:hypothetical protein